jgi:hypothetical protein
MRRDRSAISVRAVKCGEDVESAFVAGKPGVEHGERDG